MAEELRRLIERYGGLPVVVPALREIPLTDNQAARAFGLHLVQGTIHILVCMTGMGTRHLLEILQLDHSLDAIRSALSRIHVIARGPKPLVALREIGLTQTVAVPEPNTWREILQTLDTHHILVRDQQIAIQEYGAPSADLADALASRGGHVTSIPLYRWALPEDLGPLRAVVSQIVSGEIDALIVTNAAQVDHVLQVVKEEGLEEPFRQALTRIVIASIGPTASEHLRAHQLPVDFEPSHPKMGVLVKELGEQLHTLLIAKRSA
jgi:uroporphyrinogen-III synthase